MPITNSNFQTYAQENRVVGGFYFYVNFIDDNSNNYYYTDAPTPLTISGATIYIPSLVQVSDASLSANLYEGTYSTKPIHVRISNIPQYATNNASTRFSENFSSNEFETEHCIVYIGYDGISSTSDLLQYYSGKMTNFIYNLNTLEFDVIDRTFFELPAIPSSKFSRSSYTYLPEDLLGKPIPIVYGRWDNEPSGGTHYGDKSFVPAYVIEHRLDQTTPKIKLEIADHEIDAINKVFIFDDGLNTVGEIQDTISETLSQAQAEITLNTADALDMMQADFYLYPVAVAAAGGSVTNQDYSIDGDFDTYAVIPYNGSLKFTSPNAKIDVISLEPIYTESNHTKTIGINRASLEFSGYEDASWSSGDILYFYIENGGSFQYSLDYSAVNALSDVDSFNITPSSTYDLVITYNRRWDGSTISFQLQEDNGDGALMNVKPREGYYWTMGDMAAEIDAFIEEDPDSVGLSNTYSVSYNKLLNKMQIKRVTGSLNFAAARTSAISDEIGFTASSPSFSTTTYVSPGNTLLDVPDGDFSLCKLYISCAAPNSTNGVRIKGVRIKVKRAYRDYNIIPEGGKGQRRIGGIRSQLPIRAAGTRIRTIIGRGGAGLGQESQWRSGVYITDPERSESLRDQLSGSRFYASIDGKPDDSTSYWAKGPNIIEDILTEYIGLSSVVYGTSFTNAATNTQISALGLYLDRESSARDVIAELAKYSGGFVFITQEGYYKMAVVKSSYSSSDWTIYKQDIQPPFINNFKITRNPIAEIAADMTLYYHYNWATDQYNSNLNRTTNSSLNIQPVSINCPYCVDDTNADTIAEFFSGDGGTYGHFGQLKTQITINTLNPEFHLAELGDIFVFDTEWDSDIDAFGATLSGIYFMCIEKRYSRKEVGLTLLEVG